MKYFIGIISGLFFGYLGARLGVYLQREHPILAAFLGDRGPDYGRYGDSGMLPSALAIIGFLAGIWVVGYLLSPRRKNSENDK